jgi:glycosyltransferase involved in cell wall biosynthesis
MIRTVPHQRPAGASLSLVIPCCNEETVLPLLEKRVIAAVSALSPDWEIVFVDDGSADGTYEFLSRLHAREPRVKVIRLSRNFGHQTAVWAGLHYANGQVVAVLDADLQDPPELLAACLERWREGYDVMYAVRQKRKEGVLKRAAYSLFYRLLNAVADIRIPLDSGDFCVLDRRVVLVLREMGERNVFVRGMRAWSGFRQIGVPYERDERAAGESKYPLGRLVKLAVNGIVSFSTFPLRLATWIGLGSVIFAFGALLFVLAWRIFGFRFFGMVAGDVPGWTSGRIVALLIGGVQLFIMGIMGEYVARIYDEVKRRPRWVVGESLGIDRRISEAE